MTSGLKIDEATALAALDELTSHEQVAATTSEPPRIEITEAGAARHQLIQSGVAHIAARLYSGLALDDLATARRVLATVTERANAELAHHPRAIPRQ